MGSSYSGTFRIINSCKDASLPEPEIKEADGGILVNLFKDILTEKQLRKQGLNERQIKAVLYIKENGKITNQKMKEISAVSKATATRDLTELVDQYNLLVRIGETGVGTSYKLKVS